MTDKTPTTDLREVDETVSSDERPPKYVRPYTYDENGGPLSDRESQKPVHSSDISDSLVGATRRAYRDTRPNENVDTDGTRRLKFTSAWTDPGMAATLVGFIGEYNRFDPDAVQGFLQELDSETRVAVGREGSPVLYFWTPNPSDVAEGLTSMTTTERTVICHACGDSRTEELTAENGETRQLECSLCCSDGEVTGHTVSRPNDPFGIAAPDELSITVGTEVYPGIGQYNLPESFETGETVWCQHGDRDLESVDIGEYALVRAWWD